ncbi:hypothetical protein [Nocardia wallacei]|uniref:Uncharacterized protein n=1 Tax=Nocardia wallacei TaxID=480035 RepID=A0A7G1KYX0_9NOCA|nr:hypothetical protein [Nocardia wallacei]BCK58364.1 hypothetical protein NWFMUON74_61360 [Nocardia wallacei]
MRDHLHPHRTARQAAAELGYELEPVRGVLALLLAVAVLILIGALL